MHARLTCILSLPCCQWWAGALSVQSIAVSQLCKVMWYVDVSGVQWAICG